MLYYEFYDESGAGTEPLTWVDIDAVTGQIIATNTLEAIIEFQSTTPLTVKVKAINQDIPTMWND